tara:strand:+ start:1683 stop:2189 length:507 start_codon:yes stop_codon:yes gene_type:complete
MQKFTKEASRSFDFPDACIRFHFDISDDKCLIFFSMTKVFKFDYLLEEDNISVIYELDNELDDIPKFGVFNANQSKFIVNSSQDVLYVDMEKKLEIDLDEREGISIILNIIRSNDDKHFYILANKKNEMLGYYLFDVSINNPVEESQYLINWNNKLNISDVDMHILEE